MGRRIEERFDGLERMLREYGAGTRERMDALEARVARLEQGEERAAAAATELQDGVGRALALLEDLVRDRRAVVRRQGREVVLDKDVVYAAARKAGMGERTFLRRLDASGRLVKDGQGPPQRYTKKASVGGVRKRAVIILDKG